MNRRYCLVFLIFAVAILISLSLLTGGQPQSAWAIFAFVPACLLLSLAYGTQEPARLGKRVTGRFSIFGTVVLWPFWLVTLGLLSSTSRLTRSPAITEVVPGLWFGRRLFAHETDRFPGHAVLDLTAELPEPQAFRSRSQYLCLPLLDGGAPSVNQLRVAMDWLRQSHQNGPVLVHCAQGYGRSACVVLCYLMRMELVSTLDDGLRLLRSVRPGVSINREQRMRLEEFLS